MQLRRALRIKSGQTVAFTGAGGKSSAIHRLAHEIKDDSGEKHESVLITTTTRLGQEQHDLAALHLIDPSQDQTTELPQLLKKHRSVLVTGPELDGKWIPPKDSVLEELHRITVGQGAFLLIEADGARGRSLKAPANHEPVVPSFADLVVPMAAMDALDQTVNSEAVHRPERVASVLRKSQRAKIGPIEFAKVLSANEGGLKGIPDGAEVRVLLNKLDISPLDPAREIAQSLLRNPNIQSVVLASVVEEDPVQEAHARVAGVILAAGGSSRLGEPKQLIQWRGHPLIWHAVRAAEDLHPSVVVIGESAQELRRALKSESVILIENEDWETGQSSSVRLGLEAVSQGAGAVVFLLADMPFVGADLVKGLVERHRQTLASTVAARAGGRRANPVLFDRDTFSDLGALKGDQGGRAIFQRYDREFVEWDDSILLDVDTPEDLERLRELE